MRPPKAFTLIELIVVMSIIALLSSVAMIDYSTSVKKARLQVATEELILLLQDGGVRAQADPSCFVVAVPVGAAPTMSSYDWNDGCAAPTSVTLSDEEELSWSKVAVAGISASTITNPEVTISDVLYFVFSPPDGDISLYKDGALYDAQNVSVTLSYNNSDEDIFNKTVEITPVTASFVIQ